jgi:hypothetical protein
MCQLVLELGDEVGVGAVTLVVGLEVVERVDQRLGDKGPP